MDDDVAPDPVSADDPVLARAETALWRAALRGVIVHPGADHEPMLVTAPGDLVWQLLEEPTRRSAVVATLAEHFGADAASVERDLAPVLVTLIDVGAVVVVDVAPSGDA